jgi:putative transposase
MRPALVWGVEAISTRVSGTDHLGELKKALAERMLNAEMDVHLVREAEAGISNHRNGSSAKTVPTPEGELELSIPRDRHGRFDPALIAKYRRRFPGFDDKISRCTRAG